MAAVAFTAAYISIVKLAKATIKSYIAAEAMTAGQPVYINTSGNVGLADANAAGRYQFRGIALQSVGAGQAVDVCSEGEISGFTLAGAYDSLVYVADVVGTYVDAAGTKTMPVGRVAPMSDKDRTKVLRVFVSRHLVVA